MDRAARRVLRKNKNLYHDTVNRSLVIGRVFVWPLGRLSSAWFTARVYAARFDPRTRLHKMLLNPARSKSISAVNSPLFRANFAYSPLHAHRNRVVPFRCRVGWFGRDLCLVERKISMVSSDLTGGGWMLIVEIYGERWWNFLWNLLTCRYLAIYLLYIWNCGITMIDIRRG